MSELSKTSSLLLVSTLEQQQNHQQPGDTLVLKAPAPKDKPRKRSSTPSNDTIAETRSTFARRCFGTNKALTTEPAGGSSRATQRSTTTPTKMSTVNFTKTGRVSKAKKGLKVHDCECGRSYTRAEHLRRHQRNHAQEGAMLCKYRNCGKTFYRSDLLQRHEERHDEISNVPRQPSLSSTERSPRTSPAAIPASLPMVSTSIFSPIVTYPQQQAPSSQPEVTPFPRYNPSLFRTPQLPRTPKNAPSNPSNHLFHSSPSFNIPPNDLKLQSLAYPSRRSISDPVLVDGMTPCGVWHDSFAQSPYSCSSGYASPAPGPEYRSIYATPPYGPGVVRTRASSNASFIEQSWAQASHSPTSSVSNAPYSWGSDEKDAVVASFPYSSGTYPTVSMPIHTNIGTMAHYGQFDPHNVVQMDHEEGAQLFPGENYGMSHIAHTYPFEQYLNNYWRLLHPAFPVVHRFTFSSLESSPMLYAAMIAIDLQYSNNVCDRHRAQELHKLCVELLNQRETLSRSGCDRPCDDQAIFLVELFAQYCAQRCAKTLSPRFSAMYRKLAGVRSFHPSAIQGLHYLASNPEDSVQDQWAQWAKLAARQHLLLSCYVLEFQQSTLLARNLTPILQVSSDTLPFPTQQSLWDASNASEWLDLAQERSNMPLTIIEALGGKMNRRCSSFQSTVLIATRYNPSSKSAFYGTADIENHFDQTPTTRHQLLTAKLAQLLPTRALLAVSGEAWVLGTKVTSKPEFSTLETTLQAWVGQLWSCPADDYSQPIEEALHLSVAILKLSVETNEPFAYGIGNQMGLFFAALVLWCATAAASSRLIAPDLLSSKAQSTPELHAKTISTAQPTRLSRSVNQLLRSPEDRKPSMPHAEVLSNISRFLSSAIEDITTFNVLSCYTGCTSLLLWVQMHLRGTLVGEQNSRTVGGGSSGSSHGELVNEIINQIDKMIIRGWEGWFI